MGSHCRGMPRQWLKVTEQNQFSRPQGTVPAPAGSWLARMLATKPKMLVAVALANKIARVAWALMRGDGVYEAPATA